jgi:anti-sigma factor (TIGR02949 family)
MTKRKAPMARRLDCEEVISRLFEFLDRELDPALEREVEHHLADCRGCFTRTEFERRLRARIAEASAVEAPERLRRRARHLMERFSDENDTPTP